MALLFEIAIFLYSCKKDNNDIPPNNSNEIKATIVPVSGGSVIINATGDKAVFSKSSYYGLTILEGKMMLMHELI